MTSDIAPLVITLSVKLQGEAVTSDDIVSILYLSENLLHFFIHFVHIHNAMAYGSIFSQYSGSSFRSLFNLSFSTEIKNFLNQ
jgi:hypothetical protein